MTDQKKSAKQIEKEERLAKALRENLQRRKAQMKSRRDDPANTDETKN